MVEVLDVCGQRTPDRGILDCGWFYIEIHRRSASDAGAGNGRQAKREGDGDRESCVGFHVGIYGCRMRTLERLQWVRRRVVSLAVPFADLRGDRRSVVVGQRVEVRF